MAVTQTGVKSMSCVLGGRTELKKRRNELVHRYYTRLIPALYKIKAERKGLVESNRTLIQRRQEKAETRIFQNLVLQDPGWRRC